MIAQRGIAGLRFQVLPFGSTRNGHDADLDAAILLLSLWRRVGGYGRRLAHSDGLHPFGFYATHLKVRRHGCRTSFGERLVVGFRTVRVGMTDDHEGRLGIPIQAGSERVRALTHLRSEFRLVDIEEKGRVEDDVNADGRARRVDDGFYVGVREALFQLLGLAIHDVSCRGTDDTSRRGTDDGPFGDIAIGLLRDDGSSDGSEHGTCSSASLRLRGLLQATAAKPPPAEEEDDERVGQEAHGEGVPVHECCNRSDDEPKKRDERDLFESSFRENGRRIESSVKKLLYFIEVEAIYGSLAEMNRALLVPYAPVGS